MKTFLYLFLALVAISADLRSQSNDLILLTRNSVGSTDADIYQMKGDGSNVQMIYDDASFCQAIDISSDGSKIVFSSDASTSSKQEVFIMNSNGTNVQQITSNADFYGSTYPRFYGTSKIWYDRGPTAGVHEWWDMNYDGSSQTQLTNWQTSGEQSDFFYFNYNQTKVVYVKGSPSAASSHDIYISNIDLSGEVRLTNNSLYDEHPKFSPDGNTIIWSQDGNIWEIKSDGTNLQQLTNVSGSQYCYWPTFSIDGSKIYYTYYDGPAGDVYVMNNDGSAKTNITNTPNYDERAYCVSSFNPVDVENEIATVIPNIITLSQNYPNPFNPSTVIKYQIPKAGEVNLRVFDIMGKEVTRIVNEYKSAGSYEAAFNANSLASGIYLYQLKVGDFLETKKMLLLK